MGVRSEITGWKLAADDRSRLLLHFPPRYRHVIADHVTLRHSTDAQTPLPHASLGKIIGVADDGAGVQALILEIAGTTQRGDGSHYHISWSVADGRRAKESNDVLARGWQPVDAPIEIMLMPARWARQ